MSLELQNSYHALRSLKKDSTFKEGDVLVLFGELFTRGYANGLVDEAEKRGMKIIRTTVGRRDKDGNLRPLNQEESLNIPAPFINIPLEAGFDLEPADDGRAPVDFLKNTKLGGWQEAKIDPDVIAQAKSKAQKRFRHNVIKYIVELKTHIPENVNVLFAHLMAGGVPRTKIVMPLMNQVFKGVGDRHLASQTFWESEIGQFCSENFNEVTANTFNVLVEETESLRKNIESTGNHVSYLAYGYHGTEVLIGNNYIWQTYTSYLQGLAKMQLENFSRTWHSRGVHCSVYNCPEILTNSSSIFQGVEVSLYPLLGALRKEHPKSEIVEKIFKQCSQLLKPEHSCDEVLKVISNYLMNPVIRDLCQFDKWPQHSNQVQMETMLEVSNRIYNMHNDNKNYISTILSEIVFAACGKIMINDSAHPDAPVSWINHDLIAKITVPTLPND